MINVVVKVFKKIFFTYCYSHEKGLKKKMQFKELVSLVQQYLKYYNSFDKLSVLNLCLFLIL